MIKEYIYETPFMEFVELCEDDVITASSVEIEDGVTVPGLDDAEDQD